jgi:hypothetical protein
MRESIAAQERALAELTNTGAALRRAQATAQDKLARMEAQVLLGLFVVAFGGCHCSFRWVASAFGGGQG